MQQSEVIVILLCVLLMPSLQNLSGKEFYQILLIGKHKLKNCHCFGEFVFFQKAQEDDIQENETRDRLQYTKQ